MAIAGLALAGCTALSSTTRNAGHAVALVGKGVSRVSQATGSASVTAPDMPRFADAQAFVGSQRRQLAREAAAGGGEDIDALARLLNYSDDDTLGPWMQTHYAELFGSSRLSARQLVDRIDAHEG